MSSTNKRTLYQLIWNDKDWDGALERLKTDEGKEEAKTPDEDGDLPLHNACRYDPPLKVVEALLEAHPEGANTADDDGVLPLHIACNQGASAEVVKALLKANPYGIKIEDYEGMLPLHNALLGSAAMEMVSLILEAYPDGTRHIDEHGKLPIHYVKKDASAEVVKALLKANPDGIKKEGYRGKLPLHYALSGGAAMEVVSLLLEAYPEGTRHTDEDGKLPIHYLSNKASPELVRQLFVLQLVRAYPEGAAKIDKDGKLPLHYVCKGGSFPEVILSILEANPEGTKAADKDGMFPLQYACKTGSSPDVLLQLIKAFPEAATKIDKDGKLPLHNVCKKGTIPDVVRALIEAHPNGITTADQEGKLPLHYCNLKDGAHAGVVCSLLQAYPPLLYDTSVEETEAFLEACCKAPRQEDGGKNFPLYCACRNGGVNPDLVKKLLKTHPNSVSNADEDGKLPLHYACGKKPQLKMSNMLFDAHSEGATVTDKNDDLPVHLLFRNGNLDKLAMAVKCEEDSAVGADVSKESFALMEKLLRGMMHNKNACNAVGGDNVVFLPLHIASSCNVSFDILEGLLQTYQEAASRIDKEPGKGNRIALDLLEEQRKQDVPSDDWKNDFNLKSDLLFSFNPISPWNNEAERLDRLQQRIVEEMRGNRKELSEVSQRIWVWMCESDLTTSVENIVDNLDKEACTTLASIKTQTGQRLLVGASPSCGQIIRSRLLFIGRYNISSNDGPLHQSATCLILRARDYGSLQGADVQRSSDLIGSDAGDRVVIKFMHNKNQFEREKQARVDLELMEPCAAKFMRDTFKLEKHNSSQAKIKQMEEEFPALIPYVDDYDVDRIGTDSEKQDTRFKTDRDEMAEFPEFQALSLISYHYALVMPEADRTLDDIYKHERPKINQVRQIMEELAKALQKIHRRGIIHGDLKMLNVVRIKGRITLIDMDASCRTAKHIQYEEESDFVGAKFSSGVLPPEMVALLDEKGISDYEKYWKKSGINSGSSLWKKVKPSMKPGGAEGYVVKTFKGSVKDLPYKPVRPSEAIDTWSFGLLLLKLLCSDKPLFNVSRDDDLTSVQDFHELYTWDKNVASTYKDRIGRVEDYLANDLLERLLVCRDRLATMSDILQHPFFKDNTHNMTQDLVDEVAKLRDEAHTRDQEQRKRDEEQRKLLESIKKQTTRIEDNTTKLVFMTKSVKKQLMQSTQYLCKAIYEANEVKVPTTFVIFRSMLDPRSNDVDIDFQATVQTSQNTTSLCGLIVSKWNQKRAEFKEKCRELQQMGRKEQAEAFVNYLEVAESGVQDAVEIIEGIDDFLESPQEKIMELAQSSVKKWFDAYKAETAYMYLVDERTRKPVVDEKYPPYEITSTSDKMRDLIPFMQVGIKAMSIVSFGTKLASTICGLPPITIFPKWIRDSASGVVESLDKESSVVEFGVVHNSFVASKHQDETNESPQDISYRGADLRQLENFFAENDKKREFAGLCRVCGPDGSAMWTTKDGVRKIMRASLDSESETSDGEKDRSGQPRHARPTLSKSVGRDERRQIFHEKSDD